MNCEGIKFNLSEFPEGKRLEVWAEYVHLSQNIAPREITGVWYHGHLYVHRSKTNPNQFILKPPVYFYDREYQQLTLSEIFQITHDLMQTSSNKSLPARLVVQSLNRKIKDLSSTNPAVEKLRYIFEQCTDLNVPQDKPQSELRHKIQVLRKYLAAKNIYGGYYHDLKQQYEVLTELLKQSWSMLQLPGVYNPDVADKVYAPQTTPIRMTRAQSFLEEYSFLPPELKGVYEESLKEKFGNPHFLCYFLIGRQRIRGELLEILERCFKEAVIKHLSSSENLIFNLFKEETLPLDPVYVDTFMEYVKEHFKTAQPKDRKRIIFFQFHEAAIECLSFCNIIQIHAITDQEAENLAQKVKALNTQRVSWFANIIIVGKNNIGERGMKALKELEESPGPFEEGPYEMEAIPSFPDDIYMKSRKYAAHMKLMDDKFKETLRKVTFSLKYSDIPYLVKIPYSRLIEAPKSEEDDKKPSIDPEEFRRLNQQFLDKMQASIKF